MQRDRAILNKLRELKNAAWDKPVGDFRSKRFARKYADKTSRLIKEGVTAFGKEAEETEQMALSFFKLLEVSASRNSRWQFAIATGDNIHGHLEKMSPAARRNLQVFSTPRLSDTALREIASQSLAVLCLYADNMQSGIVPLAFMCGTPVIVTDIESLRESVEHKKTGYFVDLPVTPNAILDGIMYIEKTFFALF